MRDGSVGAGSTIRPSNARPRCRSSAVTRRSGCSSTLAEVVDEHLVVGRQRAAERPEVRVRVDGDDAVAPDAREQRAEQHGRVVFPTPPFGETTAIVAQRVSRGAAIARSSRAS